MFVKVYTYNLNGRRGPLEIRIIFETIIKIINKIKIMIIKEYSNIGEYKKYDWLVTTPLVRYFISIILVYPIISPITRVIYNAWDPKVIKILGVRDIM